MTLTCRYLRCAVMVPLLPTNHHHPYPCELLWHVVLIPFHYMVAGAMVVIHKDEPRAESSSLGVVIEASGGEKTRGMVAQLSALDARLQPSMESTNGCGCCMGERSSSLRICNAKPSTLAW